MQQPEHVAVVGLGLIGASFARSLRGEWPSLRLSGYDSDGDTRLRAVDLGIVDSAAASLAEAVAAADLVLIATPVRSIAGLVREAMQAAPQAIVTDTGSVKQPVMEALRGSDGRLPAQFVPGHPVAGSERFGVDAGDPTLFRGRRVILTPAADTASAAVALVRASWEATGATVEHMAADHHDEVLAATSHLPHVLAYALVDCLSAMEDRREIFAYAAGGFRDFTRIASSSPEMWRDILLENRHMIAPALDAFETALRHLRDALAAGDEAAVLATLVRSRSARQRFLDVLDNHHGSGER